MGLRLRKKNDSPSATFKIKRSINIEWSSKSIESINDIIEENSLDQKAYIFGTTTQQIIIKDVEFKNFKLSNDIKLEPTNGKKSPIVSGALFSSSKSQTQNENLKTILSTGAWAPRLPKNEKLQLHLYDLVPDDVYEIKLIFSGDGRLTTSRQIKLSPHNFEIDFFYSRFVVATGKFISPGKQLSIQLESCDGAPPFINSLIIKKEGTSPRVVTKFFSLP